MSILDELAAHARERVLADSENMSLDILQAMCREKGRANGARFYDALKKDDLSFICEVKKASPSKGVIARDFPYLDIARDYEAAGADCISCLTEPKWFLGSDDIFREIRAAVSTPMLRKDFTVSDYQLYQSRLMGADCVLLICALLDTKTLAQYLAVCDELGLSALVETHDADEIRSAVAAGAKIIGVNNRNLKDFSVNFSNAARLRDLIPPEAVYVAESGVQSAGGFENNFMISSKVSAEKAREIVRFMNWFYTKDGINLLNYGVDGKHNTVNPDGTRTIKPEYANFTAARKEGMLFESFNYRFSVDAYLQYVFNGNTVNNLAETDKLFYDALGLGDENGKGKYKFVKNCFCLYTDEWTKKSTTLESDMNKFEENAIKGIYYGNKLNSELENLKNKYKTAYDEAKAAYAELKK